MSAAPSSNWQIVHDDLSHPHVTALIDLHLREAHASSPPGSVFALDASGLRDPTVAVWTMWEGEALLGIGALKELDARHGEVKSMRTAPAHVRRGVASAMLDHLIAEARARGYRRLSLETGCKDPYRAARVLYEGARFVACDPFAGYTDCTFSRYYTLAIDE